MIGADIDTRTVWPRSAAIVLAVFCWGTPLMTDDADAQPPGTIYDEAQVPAYTLPDPLKLNDGTPVTDAAKWRAKRRAEILELFRDQVFGRSPGRPSALRWKVTSTDKSALGGMATRKEITLFIPRSSGKEGTSAHEVRVLLYVPNHAAKPVPVILGLNFDGNHTIHTDPGITLAIGKLPPKGKDTNRTAAETPRGQSTGRWSVDYLIGRGYALATVFCGDLEPDYPSGWVQGVRGFLRGDGSFDGTVWPTQNEPAYYVQGPKNRAKNDWGAIAAWAWGLSRAMDYLETDTDINPKQAVVFGHSRMGKTALWAAQDERFAMVISNNSGEGGAALARRRFGERTEHLNARFPHWFCGNFKQYSGKEDDLPVDAHELIALAAPRPVYVASAIEDRWADPRGEFLAALNAEPVYRLFNLPGVGVKEWPSVDTPVGGTIGYHVRTGAHDVLEYDWARYLDFADRHFKHGK